MIKKEILIEAPVEKVWAHITEPERIAGWLMPNDFVAKPGANFTFHCKVQGEIRCQVLEVIPPRKLAYSFKSSLTRVETVVTITLAPKGKHTRVTLQHSGWDRLPPADQGLADLFGSGWGGYLENLRATAGEAAEPWPAPKSA